MASIDCQDRCYFLCHARLLNHPNRFNFECRTGLWHFGDRAMMAPSGGFWCIQDGGDCDSIYWIYCRFWTWKSCSLVYIEVQHFSAPSGHRDDIPKTVGNDFSSGVALWTIYFSRWLNTIWAFVSLTRPSTLSRLSWKKVRVIPKSSNSKKQV